MLLVVLANTKSFLPSLLQVRNIDFFAVIGRRRRIVENYSDKPGAKLFGAIAISRMAIQQPSDVMSLVHQLL